MPRIAIFGYGVSGLFIHKAVQDVFPDAELSVYSEDSDKIPAGAFWIHDLPFLDRNVDYSNLIDFGINISIVPIGTEERYLQKQGLDPSYKSSFPKKPYSEKGYLPKDAKRFIDWRTVKFVKTGKMNDKLCAILAKNFDVVFQTFPTEASKSERSIFFFPTIVMQSFSKQASCTYDGSPDHPWVRRTEINGTIFKEFPANYTGDYGVEGDYDRWAEGKEYVIKSTPDMPTDTKVWTKSSADNIHLVGRWATWNRHFLSHESYNIAKEILEKLA